MNEFTVSDGVTLRYALDDFTDPWKKPQTLILLHAVMGDHRRAYRWIPLLSRHFRVVRPDMRGHGRSNAPKAGRLSLGRLVQDVVELADHLGCSAFHLCGASVGGIIALQTALEHPDRVATLACFATPPGLRGHTRIDHDRWIADIKSVGLRAFLQSTSDERFPSGTDPAFIEWFVSEASKTDTDFLFQLIPLMRTVDQTARLSEVHQSTLVVVPGADPHIALEQYESLQRIPNCEFIIYEGLQHNIVDVVPERCAAELLRFISARHEATRMREVV